MKTVVDSSRSRTRIKQQHSQPLSSQPEQQKQSNDGESCWPQFHPASALGASRVGFTPLVVSWKKRGQLRSQAKYKRVMNQFSKSMDETETETSSTDTEDFEDNNLDFIPMKPYNRANRSRSLPFIRQATLNSALMRSAKKEPSPTLKEGLQFLESSHNEIVYKAKKLEYILEKERREARRESLPTSETNKVSRLKAWFTSKINGKKNLRMADESVKNSVKILKTAAEMIYQMDDTMTQKEENLCQRANDLRRTSEVTFKTIDKLKHQNARRVRSNGDCQPHIGKPKFERAWSVDIDDEIDDQFLKLSERGKIGKRKEISWSQRRRKSSVSLDDNFLSQISGDTQESVLQQ